MGLHLVNNNKLNHKETPNRGGVDLKALVKNPEKPQVPDQQGDSLGKKTRVF